MNIITDPSIRLVGKLTIDEAELSAFLEDEGVSSWKTDTEIASQKLVEVAGRLCYKSYAKPRPGGNAAYLNHILEVGHGSVIEHAVYNFIITGVSRSFTHELVRHRAGFAYSQRSQRFCDESDLSVVVPPSLRAEVLSAQNLIKSMGVSAEALLREGRCTASDTAGLVWLVSVETAQASYAHLSAYIHQRDRYADYHEIESSMPADTASNGFDAWWADLHQEQKTGYRKRSREGARSVLPNATETQIFVTLNARAARHFIEMRGDASADAEIRRVAFKMLSLLSADSPGLFGDYEVKGGSITTKYRKV